MPLGKICAAPRTSDNGVRYLSSEEGNSSSDWEVINSANSSMEEDEDTSECLNRVGKIIGPILLFIYNLITVSQDYFFLKFD